MRLLTSGTLLAVQLAACAAAPTTISREAFGHDPAPDPACRRNEYPDKYVVLLTAWEQMNKNVAVVAEAAAYARESGRTFVEPVYCRSRVRPPFDGPEVIGAAFARALAVDPNYFKCDEDKAALSASRDVRTMCDAAPTITAAAFRASLAAAGPALRDDFAVLRPKDTKHSLRRGAASVSDRAVIYVWYMHRHVPIRDIATGACVRRPCYGMTFGPATHLAAAVARVAEAARPYTCLNWRSEAVSLQWLGYCAGPRRNKRRGAPRLTG